ncbi:MAG: glycosyltransferase [Terracidiphilus sp.]
MKILTVHNKYKIRGGEDESRESEDRLLQSRGHEIREIVLDNSVIHHRDLLRVGLEASWSQKSYESVKRAVLDWKPDILDVHNFFPLASPAVHYAAKRAGIPVVQTLHNFRLLCPGATFFRDGLVCEECTRYPIPIPGVMRGCYQGSSLRTSGVALMISIHKLLRTWQRTVSVFIAVSEFEKRKFAEHGFPAAHIVVKPNFVLNGGEPGPGGEDFLFVGRLSPEKGIATLLRAAEQVDFPLRLNIVGEGPLRPMVQAAAERNTGIRYLGLRPQAEVLELMAHAKCLIFPSEWYETFGRVAAEAFSRGTPVIASRLGAITEIVEDRRTGFLFASGNSEDLARVMSLAHASPDGLRAMRAHARRKYEQNYTAEHNYEMLLDAYRKAIANP